MKITLIKTSSSDPEIIICVAEKLIVIWNTRTKSKISVLNQHNSKIIFVNEMKNNPKTIESIDCMYNYIQWNWDCKQIMVSTTLFSPSASYSERDVGFLANVFDNTILVATLYGCIRSFNIENGSVANSIFVNEGSIYIIIS